MTKKDDLVRKNVGLNSIFFNKMKQLKDKFTAKYPPKRMRQFDNNYWKLVYILQFKLFNQKKIHHLASVHSKYGAELNYDNLLHVSGFRGEIFSKLMEFFDEQNVVKAVRNEQGGRSYTPGGGNYTSRATIYYIPLELVMEMQKCDYSPEWIEIETSKKNEFFNKSQEKVEKKQLKEQKVNIYNDERMFPTGWQMNDIMRIGDLYYDEQMFLQIARENNFDDPEGELLKCKESSKIGRVEINHGRVSRYGWNRLKKCLRPSVLFRGEHVDQLFDFPCADFKMMAVIGWIVKDKYKISKKDLEEFSKDVEGDFYQVFIDWYKQKYNEVLDRGVAKEGLLIFRNSTNELKRYYEKFEDIRQFFKQRYSTLTNILYNYKEVKDEDGILKNCISVHCQNVEGYIIHELILPALESVVSEPFSLYDAIWGKKSDINKRSIVEEIALNQYKWLIDSLKDGCVCFEDKNDEKVFKQLVNILTN